MTQPYGSGSQPPQGQPYEPPVEPAVVQPAAAAAGPAGQNAEQTGHAAAGQPHTGSRTTRSTAIGTPRWPRPRRRGRPNVAGLVLAVIAAVLGILSLFVFGWYRDDFRSVSGGELEQQLEVLEDPRRVEPAAAPDRLEPVSGQVHQPRRRADLLLLAGLPAHRRRGRARSHLGAADRRRLSCSSRCSRRSSRWPASASRCGPSTCSRSLPPHRRDDRQHPERLRRLDQAHQLRRVGDGRGVPAVPDCRADPRRSASRSCRTTASRAATELTRSRRSRRG